MYLLKFSAASREPTHPYLLKKIEHEKIKHEKIAFWQIIEASVLVSWLATECYFY